MTRDIEADVAVIVAGLESDADKPTAEVVQAVARLVAGALIDHHRIANALEALVRKGMHP